jgi:DNA-directed RNA polymerase subunit M/transcription elongation factor TFIIS
LLVAPAGGVEVNQVWSYKSCPRCGGDIFIDEDFDSAYLKCLQCGYERELNRKLLIRKGSIYLREQESAAAIS